MGSTQVSREAKLINSDAFDKVARLLQLPTSPSQASGAILERYAEQSPLSPFDKCPLSLPNPLSTGQHSSSLQFSFSGLISHVERTISRLHPLTASTDDNAGGTQNRVETEKKVEVSEATKRELSRRFQEAAFGHLTSKLRLALALPELENVKGVVVSGGVASNIALRHQYVVRSRVTSALTTDCDRV